MVQSKATDLVQPLSTRRHIESPRLWIAAIAGSVGAHLLLLVFTVPLLIKVSAPASGSTSSVPIELVELEAAETSLEESSQDNNGAIAAPNSTQLSPELSPPSQPPITQTPSQTSLLPSPKSPQINQPFRETTPSTNNPSETNNETLENGSESTTSPTAQPPTESGESTTPDSATPDPGNNSAQSGGETSSTQPSPSPRDSQPAGGSTGEGVSSPEVLVGRNAAPATIVASVTYAQVPPSENPRDIPDQSAVPLIESQEFISDPTQSTCAVTPESIRYLGQTVSMQVEIDAEGRVSQTFLRDPLPASQEYGDLAACLVKNWEFNPAISGGQPIDSDNLIVSITIN